MAYNTNYRIVKTKTGELLFRSSSPACFSSITNINYSNPQPEYIIFSSDKTIEVFQPEITINARMAIIKNWIRDLNSLGFPISMSAVKIEEGDDNYPLSLYTTRVAKSNVFYKFDFDYSKYSSKAHVKLGLHLLRFIYENNMPLIIDEVYRMKSAYPDDCIWELFQLACMTNSGANMSGHFIFTTFTPFKIISKLELLSCIGKWSREEYHNNEISYLQNLGRIQFKNVRDNKMLASYPEIKIGITLKEYKQLIEKLENGNR